MASARTKSPRKKSTTASKKVSRGARASKARGGAAKGAAKKAAKKRGPARGAAKGATKKRASKRYGAKSRDQVGEAMHEMKHGQLKSGRSGKKVKNPKQAVAIGLSKARRSGAKVPPAKGRSRKKS